MFSLHVIRNKERPQRIGSCEAELRCSLQRTPPSSTTLRKPRRANAPTLATMHANNAGRGYSALTIPGLTDVNLNLVESRPRSRTAKTERSLALDWRDRKQSPSSRILVRDVEITVAIIFFFFFCFCCTNIACRQSAAKVAILFFFFNFSPHYSIERSKKTLHRCSYWLLASKPAVGLHWRMEGRECA